MNLSSTFKTIFKSHQKVMVKDRDSSRFNPDKHWRLLLRLFFIFLVASAVFSAFVFREINKEEIFRVPGKKAAPIEPVNRERLKNIVDSFDQKKTFSEDIISGASVNQGLKVFTDPAI